MVSAYVPGGHWTPGSTARLDWAAGRGACPECKRMGCRGQCECPCASCQRGLKEQIEGEAMPFCDVLREAQESAEARAVRLQEAAKVTKLHAAPEWRECVGQVERLGCPHEVARWVRKPNPTAAMSVAKSWWAQRSDAKGRRHLLLLGDSGVGKSVAAAYVLAKWGELRPWWRGRPTGSPDRPVLWLSAPEVARLTLLRPDDELLLRDATSAEVLVVDDLELEGGAAGMRALASLLAARLDSTRLTVLTGNVPVAKVRDAYGNHVADRLNASAYRQALEGASLRKGAA